MLNIQKSAEPPLLASYRQQPDADWDGPKTDFCTFTQVKEAIRSSLYDEQRGLCAYCMCQLTNDSSSSIEHFFPRSKSKGDKSPLKLDYNNMLLCCSGEKQDGENRNRTCDRKKENKELFYVPNPASDVDVEEKISYEHNGTMIVPQEWESEINEILNLNAPILIMNRKSAREAFIKVYPKLRETFSDQEIIDKLSSQHSATPFLGILLYFLRLKKLYNDESETPRKG